MDNLSPPVRSKIMASIRGKDTSPEMLLRRELYRRGYRYRVHVKGVPGRPDIVFRSRRLAIFVNGCFWHAHPGCAKWRIPRSNQAFWREKFRRNRERDERDRQALVCLGWRPITIWECDIKRSVERAADVVEVVLVKHAEANAPFPA